MVCFFNKDITADICPFQIKCMLPFEEDIFKIMPLTGAFAERDRRIGFDVKILIMRTLDIRDSRLT